MDVYAHLSAQKSLERPETTARLALSRRKPPAECPRYLDALKRAFWEEYPPFATELYEEMYGTASSNGQWLAMSLISQSQREGEKAKRLWALAAACADNPAEQQLLKEQACGESKHALAYLKLLDTVFPESVDPTFRRELNQFSPGYTMKQELSSPNGGDRPSLHDYLSLNIDEIRTVVQQVFQLRAIPQHCMADVTAQAAKTLNKLLADELDNIACTADLIEQKTLSQTTAALQAFFCKGVSDFNRARSEEPIEYTYNQRFGNYP
jgi:hypothetical protein